MLSNSCEVIVEVMELLITYGLKLVGGIELECLWASRKGDEKSHVPSTKANLLGHGRS